jgi:hypothetical protein
MMPAERPSTVFQQKLHNQFLSSSRNLYLQSLAGSTERYARVRDYELQDTTCLPGFVKIATPAGYITIEDLVKNVPNGEKFVVFSWNFDENVLIQAFAESPRQTGVKHVYKVVFTDNTSVYATYNHQFLMDDNTWKEVRQLSNGDICKKAVTITEQKVVESIEYFNYLPVFDITVPYYENFCTDTIVVHNSPLCNLALNIYADNATQASDQGMIINVRCSNSKIKDEIEILLYEILNIEFNSWHWTRSMSKYGDLFILIDVERDYGITSYLPLPTIEIEREEGYDGDVNSVRFKWTYNQGAVFDNFQIIHFRILGDDTFLPYGRSALEAARRPWKQYNLMFDAMLAYRIVRAPERRVFYIDIGNVQPNKQQEVMEGIRNKLKRQPMVEEATGKLDWRFNAMALDEDYFIPIYGDSKTRVDTLAGASRLSDIDDVKLIRSELINSLGIPSAYVDDSELGMGRSLAAQQDLQFARSIQRIQKCLLSELTKMCIIHLYAKGYSLEDISSFTLTMTPPSAILEMQKLEVFEKRFSIFSNALRDKGISKRWGQKYILNLTDNEIERIDSELINDAHKLQQLSSIEMGQTAQTAFGGAGLGMLPTTTGGDFSRNPLSLGAPGTATPTMPLTDVSVGNDLVDNKKDSSLIKSKKKRDYLSKFMTESVQNESQVKKLIENLSKKLEKINNVKETKS